MGVLLVTSLSGFPALGSFPGGGRFSALTYSATSHTRAGHSVLKAIGPDESLAVQSRLGAHVATRQKLYLYPWFDWSHPPDTIVLDEKDSQP